MRAKTRIKAPPVMEFDPQGNLINSWGDAKVLGNYLHDCQVDKDGNVWIAAARSGFVQKYSHDGKLLLQIGKSGVFDSSDGTAKGKPLNSNAAQFFGPSAVDVDPENGDVYVADGHGGGNTRIAVLDKDGKFLRQWRLHHTEAEKNIEELPHCMRLSNDGLVYVCDRQANRLQAFDKMGNFKKSIDLPWKNYTAEDEDLRRYCHTLWRTFPPCTLVQKISRGTSAVSVEFSRDPNQRLIYVVNQNQRKSISWIARQERSCRRSATAPGCSSRANSSMPFVPPWIPKATSMLPKTKAAGFRDSKPSVRNARRHIRQDELKEERWVPCNRDFSGIFYCFCLSCSQSSRLWRSRLRPKRNSFRPGSTPPRTRTPAMSGTKAFLKKIVRHSRNS